MKILIPEALRGTKFSKVLSIELNDFDIERLLPGLFFLVVADGYGSSRKIREDETVDKHLDLLASNKDLVGFEGIEGKLLLERLVRTTLITTVHNTDNRHKERVASIKPYTLLSLKTAENQSLRLVDVFTYQTLKSVLPEGHTLKPLFKDIFGKGVDITERPELDGKYNGRAPLDTLTRLSILFLDGFHAVPSKVKRDKEDALGACPALGRAFGADILNYLTTYHPIMPIQAFMHSIQGLLRFELYMYTLNVVHAVNELVSHPDRLPAAMQEDFHPSEPQMYLDFTGKMDSQSIYMAKASMRRDIDTCQQFFTSNLLLRQLDSYVNKLRYPGSRWNILLENELKNMETGPRYLQKLLMLQNHPELERHIDALAMVDMDITRKFNIQDEKLQELNGQAEDLFWLDAIAANGQNEVERVVALLDEAQRGDAITKYLRWFWNVGGNEHPFSLIEGQRKYRSSWKYAPTNELLSVLVQLAATHRGTFAEYDTQGKGTTILRLQDFLDFLEQRFGILIDRPPAQFKGTEYVAAARENLHVMLRRLRQMGIFRDLSDDFTAQSLQPPYVGEVLTQMEV